jgi:hypothetical protein
MAFHNVRTRRRSIRFCFTLAAMAKGKITTRKAIITQLGTENGPNHNTIAAMAAPTMTIRLTIQSLQSPANESYRLPQQSDNLLNRPDVVCDARFHRWRHVEPLMHASEVVRDEVWSGRRHHKHPAGVGVASISFVSVLASRAGRMCCARALRSSMFLCCSV